MSLADLHCIDAGAVARLGPRAYSHLMPAMEAETRRSGEGMFVYGTVPTRIISLFVLTLIRSFCPQSNLTEQSPRKGERSDEACELSQKLLGAFSKV